MKTNTVLVDDAGKLIETKEVDAALDTIHITMLALYSNLISRGYSLRDIELEVMRNAMLVPCEIRIITNANKDNPQKAH